MGGKAPQVVPGSRVSTPVLPLPSHVTPVLPLMMALSPQSDSDKATPARSSPGAPTSNRSQCDGAMGVTMAVCGGG